MKRLYPLFFLLLISLGAYAQPHLRISSIVNFPDTAYEVGNYDSILVTVVNDGNTQFNDNLSIQRINYPDDLGIKQVRIYDASGKEYYRNSNVTKMIPIEDLPAGIYMVEIRTADGNRMTRTFLKN